MDWIETLEAIGGILFGLILFAWIIYFTFWLVFGQKRSFRDWLLWGPRRGPR